MPAKKKKPARKKNVHAVELGRLGGRATAKKRKAKKKGTKKTTTMKQRGLF